MKNTNKKNKIKELRKASKLVIFPTDAECQKQFQMLDQTTMCIINEMDHDSQPDRYLSDLTQSQFPSLDSINNGKAKKNKTGMSGVGKKPKKKSPKIVEEVKHVVQEEEVKATDIAPPDQKVTAAIDENPEPFSPLEEAKS